MAEPDTNPLSPASRRRKDRGDGPTRRESALEAIKRKLAETEIEMPRVEGYPLHKARKILDICGFPLDKVQVRYTESSVAKGTVIRQSPAPGEKVDVRAGVFAIKLQVSDKSIVRFLPSIYQRSDLGGRNFLGEFLWIFQHIFNQTEEKLQNIERYFDPLLTPPDFLPWLASWVAMTLEDDWPEIKRRDIIKKAVELYHLRGTLRGMKIYLKIFTGFEPIIHENEWPFNGIVVGVYSTIGEDTILMHAANKAYTFVVELPLTLADVTDEQIRRIHRIIEREKPAHTQYYLKFQARDEEEDFGIVVGEASTIGVDTDMAGDPSYLKPM